MTRAEKSCERKSMKHEEKKGQRAVRISDAATMSLVACFFPLDRAKSSEITRLTLEPLGNKTGESRIFPDRALSFPGDTNRCRITGTVFKPDSLIPLHRRSNRPRRALDDTIPWRKGARGALLLPTVRLRPIRSDSIRFDSIPLDSI